MPDPRAAALQKATGIGPASLRDAILNHLQLGEAARVEELDPHYQPRPTEMRARTGTERAKDAVRDALEWLAPNPSLKVATNAVGFDLGDLAHRMNTPSDPNEVKGTALPMVPGLSAFEQELARAGDQTLAEVAKMKARQGPNAGVQLATEGDLADLVRAPAVKTGKTMPLGQAGDNPLFGVPLKGKAVPNLGAATKRTGGGTVGLRDATFDRIADLTEKGRREFGPAAGWKSSLDPEFLGAFAGDQEKADNFARLWAAMSPRTDTSANTKESANVWLWKLQHPNESYTYDVGMGFPDKVKVGGSKTLNANRSLSGTIPEDKGALAWGELSGDKVEAMSGFNRGLNRKPIDTHAIYGSGVEHKTDWKTEVPSIREVMSKAQGVPLWLREPNAAGKGGRYNIQDPEVYRAFEGMLTDALGEINPHQPTNDTFAEFWGASQAHKGETGYGSLHEILKPKGLLEYGAMLDEKKLAEALKKSNWTKYAIESVLAAIAAYKAGGGTAASEPAQAQPSIRSKTLDAMGASQ